MQFSININQKAVVDLSKEIGIKLDWKDAAIVEYLKNYAGSGEMEVKVINGEPFYRLSYTHLIEEMPLLEIGTRDQVGKRIKKLVEAKILKLHVEANYLPYIAFGVHYIRLIKAVPTQDVGGSGLDPKGFGLKTGGGSGSNPTYHNTTTSLEDSAAAIKKVGDKNPAPSQNENVPTTESKPKTHTTLSKQEPVSESLQDFLDFELDDQRRLFAKHHYNLTDEEIDITLISFKDEPKYRREPPENPGKIFMNWLKNEGMAKLDSESRKAVIKKAAMLKEQRVEQFHEKKTAIIEKVGTNPKPYSGNYHSGPVEPEVQLDIGRNNPIGDYRGRLAKTTARVYSADFPDEGAFKDYMAELLRIEKLNIIAMDFDLASIKRQFPAVPKLVLGEVEPAFVSEEEMENRRQKALNQS